ncbi:MAG: hypothetical protein WD024_00875 [Bacillota bacterium]
MASIATMEARIGGSLGGGKLINAVSVCILQRMTAEQMATLQIGPHPALTASPVAYQPVNAAEQAWAKMRHFLEFVRHPHPLIYRMSNASRLTGVTDDVEVQARAFELLG